MTSESRSFKRGCAGVLCSQLRGCAHKGDSFIHGTVFFAVVDAWAYWIDRTRTYLLGD